MHTDLSASGHPLGDTVAAFAWLILLLPLLGFVANGLLSLTAAAQPGPADPSAGHGHDGAHHQHDAHDSHDAHAAGHDHHPARHPAARWVSLIGPGVLATAFGLALAIFLAMRGAGEAMHAPYVLTLFDWIPTGALQIPVSLQLDPLSMVMVLIITGIGTLIHLFSVGYMQDDPGYPRYFA